MKKSIFKSIFTAFILVLLTNSCTKEEKVTNELELSTTQINFPKSGGTAVVGVYSNNPWGVVPDGFSDNSWIDFELTYDRVLITCPPNYTGSSRNANLSVSSYTGSASISINQSGW